jgi:hypothetical protein
MDDRERTLTKIIYKTYNQLSTILFMSYNFILYHDKEYIFAKEEK